MSLASIADSAINSINASLRFNHILPLTLGVLVMVGMAYGMIYFMHRTEKKKEGS